MVDVALRSGVQAYLSDDMYERHTCGMAPTLVKALRDAKAGASEKTLCEDILSYPRLSSPMLEALGSPSVLVIVAPPLGKATAAAARGVHDRPDIVIWLLLDSLDIDSKQTTFVLRSSATKTQAFSSLYKLDADQPQLTRDALQA